MARYDPDHHHRRSIRLRDYDYRQGRAYFVTICARHRECLFGEVAGGRVQLTRAGMVVTECWDGLPRHYPTVDLDAIVVMPNHVHGIIVLNEPTDSNVAPRPLSEVVRAFKTFSARRINEQRNAIGTPAWQRNYYDHIVRNEVALHRLRAYIANNPANWAGDQLHPDNPSKG